MRVYTIRILARAFLRLLALVSAHISIPSACFLCCVFFWGGVKVEGREWDLFLATDSPKVQTYVEATIASRARKVIMDRSDIPGGT